MSALFQKQICDVLWGETDATDTRRIGMRDPPIKTGPAAVMHRGGRRFAMLATVRMLSPPLRNTHVR